MHEFSLASQIFEITMKKAKEHNATKVLSVELVLGELTLAAPEQIGYWLKEMGKGTIAEGLEVVVRDEPAEVRCKKCGYEGGLEVDGMDHFAIAFICPKCGSNEVEILKGKTMLLKRVEMVK